MSAARRTEHRRAEIAKIKIAQKQMGFDDELYRSILERLTGKRSAADLDARERGAVIQEFRRMGFRDAPSKRAGRARLADSPQSKLIRALWLELLDLGALRDSSERALSLFSERTCAIRELGWLDQAHAAKVIGALQQWRDRVASERCT
jgi:phage gp16-like protein